MPSTETPVPDDTESVDQPTGRLEEEGEIAADYLEELLDIADLDGDIDIDVEHDRAAVEIVADDDTSLDALVGADGEVLEALQELTRLAVQARTGERSRLMLDVAGFRARRRRELTVLAEESIARARSEGTKVALEPLNAFERKVVHDVVSAAGLRSDSEGVEPNRHVVIYPEA
ncbi:protein jag [Cellulosimicrobium sp. NPDC057127]|uniref:Jag family protein n=1 Tax=Cellulosimicrobium sp. NPDC057127 TaxID=3346026 RepID=UPI003636D0AC